MNREVITAMVKMCARVVLLTAVIGAVIAAIGYFKKWDSSTPYSNAFFVAGCLVIIAGASSRYAAGGQSSSFRDLAAESFRGMSSGERMRFIVDASSPLRTVILGVLTGLLLILISAIVMQLP